MLIPYSIIPIGGGLLLALILYAAVLRSRKIWNFRFTTVGRRDFTRKTLSVLLLLVFAVGRLFRKDVVYGQLGLDAVDARLPEAEMIPTAFIYWFGLLTLAMAVLAPFFRKRALHDYVAFLAPVSAALSSLHMRQLFAVTTGIESPLHWRNLLFVIELTLIATIAFSELFLLLRRRAFGGGWRRIGNDTGFILTYLIPFMPAWLPSLFLGALGREPEGFCLEHRLLLYFAVFIIFYFYITLRNKSYDERSFALITLAMSAFFNFFSVSRTGVTGLPLHLCHTAIMMSFLTYVFRLKGLFYFTYLVNVLGALIAMLAPNTSTVLTEAATVIFWYNHIYAFALPLLGVALGYFPKPTFKMVSKAIGVFTIYFLVAATLDGWFSNWEAMNPTFEEVDYFFLYSTFYLEKFPPALPLRKAWDVYVGGQLVRYFPLYQLTVYVVFVALMFVLWGVYATLYRVSDDHRELTRRKKLLRDDHLRLLAELGDRPLSAPLNPEGENMIKIEHFTKIYNGSTRKSADDINLEIHAGEVFGFIGHNGAGKSTTIKSLVGIQSITEGRIEIEGYDIARQPMEAKMHIGYVSDNHAVYEKLTGREYVNYVADLYRVSAEDREARLDKYVKMFHLEEAIDREIKGYSHGMKQKIMVISALIHNPKVWVLDEPLTGLDPTSSYQIKQCMREHANEGNIVFFSSHIIEVVERICDRIAIISGGKIRQHSTMDEIRASGKSLEEIYLSYIDGPEGALLAKERAEEAAKRSGEATEQ